MKATKTTINTLKVGDSFKYLGGNSNNFTVVRIENNETIFFTSNGREYNCRYDNARINKIN